MTNLKHPSKLVVVLAVVAIAAASAAALGRSQPSASPVTTAQVKKIAKSIADAEIRRLAPGLSVKSATTANSHALYARLTGSGSVTANSRGIAQANVVHPRPGLYCFLGLSTAPQGGVVEIDAIPGSGIDLSQLGLGAFTGCPAGTQAYVATVRAAGGLVDDPFFVVFWF